MKSEYKKCIQKTNHYKCGCCWSGEREPKSKRHKVRLRQQGKQHIREQLNGKEITLQKD